MTYQVLLVEDQAGPLIAEVLEFYGQIKYTCAKTGNEGLEFFVAHPPDLVLLDLRLPGISGLALLEAFKKIDPQIPVIIVSAHNDKKTRDRCRELKADGFFYKPPSYPDLFRKMMALLTGRTIRRHSQTIELDQRQPEILAKYRRLAKLKEQAARKGNNTPPEISMEIEDLEREIELLISERPGE